MRLGHLFALIAVVLWSGNSVVGKLLVDVVAPVSLTTLRFLVALVTLGLVLWRHWSRWRRVRWAEWILLGLCGLTGVLLFNSLLYTALRYSSALNVGLMSAASPLTTMLLSRVFTGERSHALHYAGFAIAFGGVAWILSQGSWSILMALQFNLGDLLALAASAAWSVYSLIVRKLAQSMDLATLNLFIVAIGVLMLMPVAAMEQASHPLGLMGLRECLLILFLGWGPSTLSFLAWSRAIREIGPARAMGIYNLVPVFSTLNAMVFLGEQPAAVFLSGGAAVVIGAYAMSHLWPQRPARTDRQPRRISSP